MAKILKYNDIRLDDKTSSLSSLKSMKSLKGNTSKSISDFLTTKELQDEIANNDYYNFEYFLQEKLNLSQVMHTFINDMHNNDWYAKIGEYLLNTLSIVIDNDKILNIIGVDFLTSKLSREISNELWGEPVKHQDKFAYFVEIEGHLFCFFTDSRGASIYADSELSPEEVFKCIKIVIKSINNIDPSYLDKIINKFSKFL